MRSIVLRSIHLFVLLALTSSQALSQLSDVQRRAGSTLPASLTNAQFWSIVSEFSEEGGTFASDNYTSNELMIGQVAADLVARGRTGGAYLGVGPEQNFTYVAATKPEIVFIVDIRRQAVMQHLMYKALFEMSADRGEFIARLFSKPVQTLTPRDTSMRDIWLRYLEVPGDTALHTANIAAILNHLARVRGFTLSAPDSQNIALVYETFFRHGPLISYSSRANAPTAARVPATGASFLSLTLITDTTGVPRSFLATDENFRFIKGMHEKNLFIPVVGNFGGPHALRRVAEYLHQHNTVLSGYYTSNVEQYLFRPLAGGIPLWQQYYDNVAAMPVDSASIFIRPNGLRVSNVLVTGAMQGLPGTSMPIATGTGVWTSTSIPRPASGAVQSPSQGSVTGVVKDSATGAPLAGGSINIAGTDLTARTDNAGYFLIPNVPPGTYSLEFRRPGYAPMTVGNLRVPMGAPTIVNLQPTSQPLALSGSAGGAPPTTASRYSLQLNYVQSSGGNFVLVGGIALCPMTDFLAAVQLGKVQSYNDATMCIRP